MSQPELQREPAPDEGDEEADDELDPAFVARFGSGRLAVPGWLPAPAWVAGPGSPAPPGASGRSPDEVRDMLSSYRTGLERGRHESGSAAEGEQQAAPEEGGE